MTTAAEHKRRAEAYLEEARVFPAFSRGVDVSLGFAMTHALLAAIPDPDPEIAALADALTLRPSRADGYGAREGSR